MSAQKRYTVRYRDADSITKESCYYANDAFEARVLAMEMVRYIHDHPHAIDLIRCESYPLRHPRRLDQRGTFRSCIRCQGDRRIVVSTAVQSGLRQIILEP